jgi:serine phosphatase RsbU (regulator of sigma subunit)
MEFRHEFVQETSGLLQRRLVHFVYLIGGFWFITAAIKWVLRERAILAEPTSIDLWHLIWAAFNDLILMLGFLGAWYIASRKSSTKQLAAIASVGIVSLYGIHLIVSDYVLHGYEVAWLMFAALHLLAAIHFPWTTYQAIIPISIFVGIRLIYNLADDKGTIGTDLISAIFTMLAGAPGIIVCSVQQEWRERNFGYKLLHSRYGKLRSELASARRIHEALFPEPCLEGPVHLTYQYEPMRHIGGDYLYVDRHTRDDGSQILSVVLLDVTGHGVPAALTVNRLHGEVELLFADHPEATPGEVLCALNRYIHLTLAKHSIYATALCMRFDPAKNKLESASGGHPPAFLIGTDGSIEDIPPTTFVLGACRCEDFDHNQLSFPYHPGDRVLAYTDGAIEARKADGAMLRIDGLRSLVASNKPAPGTWPEKLLTHITNYRQGAPTEDDTLFVEVFRPIDRQGSANHAVPTAAKMPDPQITQ